MVSLDVRPPPRTARAEGGRDGRRTEWLVVTGSVAAALGAAVAMAFLSAVTVLLWACGPLATDGVSAAPFRGAAALWLMSQRAPLDAGIYDLVLPPLAVTALAAVLLGRLANWAVRATSAYELRPAATVGSGVVLGHVVVAGIAAWVSDRAGGGVDLGAAVKAALVFAVVCTVAGIAPQTWIWARIAARWGPRVRVVARAAARGAGALAAGSALVLVASLVVHHQRAADLLDLVGGGIGGTLGTTLLCLALAPNAVLWVTALATGPGFALGTDAGLSLHGDLHAGALPAMPLLAALPGAGPLPAYAGLLVLIPIGAGAVIGWYARPAAGPRGWREELITAGVAGVLCGLGIGVLAGLSGGGAGGRLASVGPDGLLVGLLLALQLAGASLALAGGRIGWERYRGPRTPAAKAGPAAEVAAEVAAETPVETPVDPQSDSQPLRSRLRGLIPRQKTPAPPVPAVVSAEPDSTPIVVVEASEVEDLPAGQAENTGAAEDAED